MKKNKNSKEKICAFYASDYHFEMMSLPYISQKLDKKSEVIILTQNNLEKTMKDLVSKTNLKEGKKEEILKINWENNDLEKFKKIKEKTEDEKEIIIFVKGNENYIQNVNKNIEKWIPEEKETKIIDCYPIEEVGDNLENIIGDYKKVVQTTGEKEL